MDLRSLEAANSSTTIRVLIRRSVGRTVLMHFGGQRQECRPSKDELWDHVGLIIQMTSRPEVKQSLARYKVRTQSVQMRTQTRSTCPSRTTGPPPELGSRFKARPITVTQSIPKQC